MGKKIDDEFSVAMKVDHINMNKTIFVANETVKGRINCSVTVDEDNSIQQDHTYLLLYRSY